MGIDIPDLDDQAFEEIFEDARRQIPVHSSDWRDHNTHDTGIAILEMLAWLSETHAYQIDRITDEHRRKHLQLLGMELTPPQPATTRVAVEPPAGTDGVAIPPEEPLSVDDQSGVTKQFETTSEAVLTEASIAKVVTHAGDDAVNRTTEAQTDNTQFHAFGEDPERGNRLYLGFDGDPFASADSLTLTVDYYDEDLPAPAAYGDIQPTFEPSVELAWEYCTAYEDWEDDAVWAPLPVARDETDSLYTDGRITLDHVPGWDLSAETRHSARLFGQEPGLSWIRCRVETPGYEISPRIDRIRTNVMEVSHSRTVRDELLAHADERLETTIQADQEFFFENAPVLEATISIDGQRWTAVDDLTRSGPDDRHYVLNHSRGSITFGDGINGAKPPVGTHVQADTYTHGGGTAGNISADASWEFQHCETELGSGVTLGDVPLTPTGSATGGTDMESIDDALTRFKRDFKRTYRAATLDDYVTVATQTPGLRFGRAHATQEPTRITGDQEYTRIRVVAVPYSQRRKPQPSRGFLDAVRTHLERTRLLTDPVTVEEPSYVDIGIQMEVEALPGYAEAELIAEIRSQLATYLHPIEGSPWPFGQSLFVSDVRTVVNGIAGVRSVMEVTLSARGEEGIDDHGNVLIDEMALLSLSADDVTVTVGTGVNR